jgi:hypothetical protein
VTSFSAPDPVVEAELMVSSGKLEQSDTRLSPNRGSRR